MNIELFTFQRFEKSDFDLYNRSNTPLTSITWEDCSF